MLAKYGLFYPVCERGKLLKNWQELDQYRRLKRIGRIEELFEQGIGVGKILSFSQDEEAIRAVRKELGQEPEIAVAASFACNLEVTGWEQKACL